jgi:hypothetical protein
MVSILTDNARDTPAQSTGRCRQFSLAIDVSQNLFVYRSTFVNLKSSGEDNEDPGKPLYMSVMKMYEFLAKNPK